MIHNNIIPSQRRVSKGFIKVNSNLNEWVKRAYSSIIFIGSKKKFENSYQVIVNLNAKKK